MTPRRNGLWRTFPALCLCASVVASFLIGCQTVHRNPPPPSTQSSTPSWQLAINSRTDLWGDAALHRPDGPTYDYFAKLLPPLRYVDADFHYYPIPLSAPGAEVKGRVLSNGSQFNALAHQPNWINETGMPVHVLIGSARRPFGENLSHLTGPHYLDGYLPIVHLAYQDGGDEYSEETFASVDSTLASSGAILIRFTFPAAHHGRVELRFEDGYIPLIAHDGQIEDPKHKILASYDANWQFNSFRSALSSNADHARTATVAIYTTPISSSHALTITGAAYDQQRSQCQQTYNDLLARGTTIDVPEERVNNAWRSLLISTCTIRSGDDLNYSASNQYARMYPPETGDAITALLLYGHAADAADNIPPILQYHRPNLEYHDAAFKLQTVATYYRLTHDEEFIRSIRPLWQREIDRIVEARERATGLLPREQYCTDIKTLVHNLASNCASWRALRDMIFVLDDLGETDESQRLKRTAVNYHVAILNAIDRNIIHTIPSPGTPEEGQGGGHLFIQNSHTPTFSTSTREGGDAFIPIALGEESVHDPITATRLGSYWNLVIGYVLDSGVFSYNSPVATDILQYQQTHGGICMGMIRCQSNPSFWINTQNIDDLYGIRYALTLLKRDEPDRALVSFYGKLAQGLTPDTYIGAEGTSIQPLDQFGRQMYLPPNTASAANFLQQLRYLLIQDWDLHDTGHPDTLRLLFATPRAWLADGKSITIRNAPTSFGPLSLSVHSQLNSGQLSADIDLPDRAPQSIFLRLRLPNGHKLIAASAAGRDLKITGETLDLSNFTGHVSIEVKTK